jgi:ProP effector
VTDEKQDGEPVASNKQQRRADNTAVIAKLAELFPKAFAVGQQERRSLKIGIDADLGAKGVIEPRALWRPLRVYCSSFGYLRTVTAGAERVDLDGNPAGVVTPEAAALAQALLAARADKEKRRRDEKERQAIKQKPAVATRPTSPQPKRVSLADLRHAAAEKRKSVRAGMLATESA